MASLIKLKNTKTGEVVWKYTVDAKEMFASKNSPWIHMDETRNAGNPTPSRATAARVSPESQKVKGVATEVVEALAAVGAIKPPEAPVAPEDLISQDLTNSDSPDTVEVGSTVVNPKDF